VGGGEHGDRGAGVARGRLDNRAARLEVALAFGLLEQEVRSLTEPVGFMNSGLTRIVASTPNSLGRTRSLTSGVLPTVSVISSA